MISYSYKIGLYILQVPNMRWRFYCSRHAAEKTLARYLRMSERAQ